MATESHQQSFASSPRNTIEATLQTDSLQGRERNRRHFSQKLFFPEHLLERVSRASQLEIIYEEREGEVVENGECLLEFFRRGLKEFEGLCYSEREIGESSSSETLSSESPENLCFLRDKEEEDGLFDITFEEDILFEIDLLAG
ncbi:hypothetical protein HPP92_000917 [Vanilla planifolia]|uniref:Uncharacterized protein n=1 Tax=Vanilla planifolia TaxID=51239 RepID=A0A835VH37_VANPL|nr:hypothetical protein HPP92_000917 [Vanilla planifolia]